MRCTVSSQSNGRSRAIARAVPRRALSPQGLVLLAALTGGSIVGGVMYPVFEDWLAALMLAGIAFVMIVGASAPALPGARR
jgi:hypothetical protein